MRKIGNLFSKGEGVSVDKGEAMRWYRKAAGRGNAVAMRNIGNLFWRGDGVSVDKEEAMRWYRKAAELGDALAAKLLEGFARDNP
jgi:TPR repeat protein